MSSSVINLGEIIFSIEVHILERIRSHWLILSRIFSLLFGAFGDELPFDRPMPVFLVAAIEDGLGKLVLQLFDLLPELHSVEIVVILTILPNSLRALYNGGSIW